MHAAVAPSPLHRPQEENGEKLEAFHAAVNSNDNSHLVTVPPGTILSDMLFGTPIFMEEVRRPPHAGFTPVSPLAGGGMRAARAPVGAHASPSWRRRGGQRCLWAVFTGKVPCKHGLPAPANLPPPDTANRAHRRRRRARAAAARRVAAAAARPAPTLWTALTTGSWAWTPPWTRSWCVSSVVSH